MKTMTSAYANKLLRQLNEDKEFWLQREKESCVYVAAVDEEPVIPEYDYEEYTKTIQEIDNKIAAIRHALNVTNSTNKVDVAGKEMTVDEILIRMAQANNRKTMLDWMRKQLPKSRQDSARYGVRTGSPEYCYINYDLSLVKSEFERLSDEIMQMQIALDKYNQTVDIEVDL